jgi:hypothetical protein
LLDVSAALGPADENDIKACGALCKGGVLTKKDLCSHCDPSLLSGRDGPSGLILSPPLFNFDKGEVIIPPRNKVDLARFRFVALR